MALKYRKIDPRVWRDERFATLTSDEKLVALYCLTAQSNRCGLFVFSPAMAAEELGITSQKVFLERFGKVVATLRWRWDADRRVLYLPTWWKYNPPENANVLRGNLRDLESLPDTRLLAEFVANLRYLAPVLHGTFRQRYPERSPQPSPNQEQEQEQYSPYPPEGGADGGGAEPTREPKTDREADPLFLRFWGAYPSKVGKPAAARAFAKHDPDEPLVALMLAAIARQARGEKWLKDGGQYIPNPATWLNQRRWEDETPSLSGVPAAPSTIKTPTDFQLNGAPAEPMTFGPRKES